jgi:hypothetical protein
MGFISRNYRRLGDYGDRDSAPKESLRLYCWCRGKHNIVLLETVRLSANLVCEMRKTRAAVLIIGKNFTLPGVGHCYIRF